MPIPAEITSPQIEHQPDLIVATTSASSWRTSAIRNSASKSIASSAQASRQSEQLVHAEGLNERTRLSHFDSMRMASLGQTSAQVPHAVHRFSATRIFAHGDSRSYATGRALSHRSPRRSFRNNVRPGDPPAPSSLLGAGSVLSRSWKLVHSSGAMVRAPVLTRFAMPVSISLRPTVVCLFFSRSTVVRDTSPRPVPAARVLARLTAPRSRYSAGFR